MDWLSSSRVRLGLLVNGLYFLSLLAPSPPPARPHGFARSYDWRTERLRSTSAPDYAPLPPQWGPLKAEVHYWQETDQLDVYLTRDLTLVRRRGHTLLLSPTYSTGVLRPSQPSTVLMRFVSLSHEQYLDNASTFVITADGSEVWRSGRLRPGDPKPSGAKPLHSAAFDGSGQVVETLGHELPYDVFARIIGAGRVTVELGPDRVELTPEQVGALRDMHRRLPRKPARNNGRN